MLSAKDLNRPGENIEDAILQKKYQDERSIDRASIPDPSTYTTGWAIPLFWYIVCKKIEGTLSQQAAGSGQNTERDDRPEKLGQCWLQKKRKNVANL